MPVTLIGDTVNVAARVEQLTKTTGDAILLTQQTLDALTTLPPRLTDRGFHVLKGKSAEVQVFGLDEETDARVHLTKLRGTRPKPLPRSPSRPRYFRCDFREPTTLVMRRSGVAGVHQVRRTHRKAARLRGEDSCSGLATGDHCRFL